ncbi:hypothetical protein D5F01_LYC09375 [Larimichthys crocea]|uniref:Uncharacterized protein n=1 Tax=Larimichthys crocea TaxID=215358 RepID=A0A6G0IL77_LARCR|nr:hypothetical protein D5F01_LYC09375 [Larimichthys crocea]
MKYSAGFLKVVCTWIVILMQSSDAGPVPKKHVDAVSCRLRELTVLTKNLIEASLTSFDAANGNDLGNWSSGFPELQVQQNSSVDGSKVQCSLHFVAEGLEKILEDQKNHLNTEDISLHEKLKNSIARVKMLAACMKESRGGECSPEPSPPIMPKHAFDRKQWSHTLLQAARDYLGWLKLKLGVQMSKVKEKNKIRIRTDATHQRYLEGSGHLL